MRDSSDVFAIFGRVRPLGERFKGYWHEKRIAVLATVFKPYRADYYAYLSEMIALNGGGKTLLKILESDAFRYRHHGARGVLAAYWAKRLSLSAGDVYATFERTLPQEDIIALRAAQLAGGESLSKVLGSLGRSVRIADEARRSFVQTITVGVSAGVVALLSVLAIPIFTHERLFSAFSTIPSEFYGIWTIRFELFARVVHDLWFLALFVCFAGFGILTWSVSHYVGRLRSTLDRFFIWRLYRSLHAMRFLALLAVLIQPQGSDLARLRQALVAMTGSSSRWLDHHLQIMLLRIDVGVASVQALDTGLIDEQTWWFLCDVEEIAGLDQAIFRTANRLGGKALNEFKQCAVQMRWSLLILAVVVVLTIALWHFTVIDELRQAMAITYAFN